MTLPNPTDEAGRQGAATLLSDAAVNTAMDGLLARADAAGNPFAAGLLDTRDGSLAAVSLNSALDGDPTAHAEMNVLREAAADGLDTRRCVLVTTAECCPMCAGAAGWAGVTGVVYGSSLPTLAGLGIRHFPHRMRDILTGPTFSDITVRGAVREGACDALFARWAAETRAAPGTTAAPTSTGWRPPGFRSVTPYLAVEDTSALIEFYEAAFGARRLDVVRTQDGTVTHAEVAVGDCLLQIHDVLPVMRGRTPRSLGGTTVTLTLYTANVDEVLRRARPSIPHRASRTGATGTRGSPTRPATAGPSPHACTTPPSTSSDAAQRPSSPASTEAEPDPVARAAGGQSGSRWTVTRSEDEHDHMLRSLRQCARLCPARTYQ
ncbi:hypothetical protein GCM10010329_80250 [Streptomyces spiroverticillatus]|nr:hypothetical protein GCM10010329_80250 [Streptomyces spiroverticillatus]